MGVDKNMKILYNLITANAELIFYVIVEALIVICVISHIFVAKAWKRKGIRLFFCIFSALIICSCAVLAIALKGYAFDFLAPIVIVIKTIEPAPYLINVLVAAASCEFTGMLYLLTPSPKKEQEISLCVETTDFPLPDNTRKKNVRKHGEYKIIKKES